MESKEWGDSIDKIRRKKTRNFCQEHNLKAQARASGGHSAFSLFVIRQKIIRANERNLQGIKFYFNKKVLLK